MFDPYHKWLGIPPQEQPPNHYRLLGLALFESNADVIDAAANRQMAYVQSCATGPHASLSQKLLNELAAARLCLLDPVKRASYNATLKPEKVASGHESANPTTVPTPEVLGRDKSSRSGRSFGDGSEPETTPASTVPLRDRPRRSPERISERNARPPIMPEEREFAFEHLPVRRPVGTTLRRGREGNKRLIQVTFVLTLSIIMFVIGVKFWKSFGDSPTQVRIVKSSPIYSNPAVEPASTIVTAAVKRAEVKHRSPPGETLVEVQAPPYPKSVISPERTPALQGEQNQSQVSAPRSDPMVATKERLDIRRLRVSVSETGKCEVAIYSAENEVIQEPMQRDLTLAGLSDARIVMGENGRHTITHIFREAKGISDFAWRADGRQGASLNRRDGTLVLTPISQSRKPSKSVELLYKRRFMLPIAFTLDLDNLPADNTSILEFDLAGFGYEDRLAIQVSENPNKKGAIWLKAAWHPRKRLNKRMPVMTQFNEAINPAEPGGKSQHEFQIPLNGLDLDQVFCVNVLYNGLSPAVIGRMSVDARIVPILGIKLGMNKSEDYLVVDMVSMDHSADMVSMDSPAFRAGLRKGDIVIRINKTKNVRSIQDQILKLIKTNYNLYSIIPSHLYASVQVGESLVFSVLRDGKIIEVSVRAE